MTKHYSPARRDNYRATESRRKLRDQERKRAREGKVRAREGSKS